MKFMALALTLLLAVGCHAASMQSDADSQMDDSGPALIVFLEKVKNIVENALANLSDTDHEKFKDQLSNDLDMILNLIKNLTAEPYIYALSDLIKEATAAVHEFIHTEIHSLRTDLENRRINLNTVLWKHVNRILIKVNPIITEYARKHRAGIDALTAKLGPLVMEMITMLLTAQDDTREIMKPIGEALDKLDWSLQDLRTMVETYVAVQLREAITVVEQVTIEPSTQSPAEGSSWGVRSTSTETHGPHTFPSLPQGLTPHPGTIKSRLSPQLFSLKTNTTR
ncbi:apolipoprotein A-I-like [Myripristis murdjan]|uniref:apolipoprotein A-I-like n=1 Tax=Myripristis murdjan TaxID=586833 RepID=UPI001175DB12|nr:apolipoprotein A-I-like [Myripristis murdjan]